MKVIIFGATGGTGKELVKQCLAANFAVSVLVRDPQKLGEYADKVRQFVGDVREKDVVAKAVEGQDAALVALGIIPGARGILSTGTKYIVEAMLTQQVKRLVCVTGAGVTGEREHLPFLWRIVMGLPLMRDMFDEKKRQEEIIRESGLEWVLVRPANLTNGEHTGKYRASENLQLSLTSVISRADVADFMVKQLSSDEWVHKTPIVSY
jgi:uncharacterized protein YbjT (DUF2867 family)